MTHLRIEHRIEWPLGDAWAKGGKLLPHEYVLLDVRADWDPSDDWVKSASYSIGIEFESVAAGFKVLDQVRGELTGMLDHALTTAIDNAKESRRAV